MLSVTLISLFYGKCVIFYLFMKAFSWCFYIARPLGPCFIASERHSLDFSNLLHIPCRIQLNHTCAPKWDGWTNRIHSYLQTNQPFSSLPLQVTAGRRGLAELLGVIKTYSFLSSPWTYMECGRFYFFAPLRTQLSCIFFFRFNYIFSKPDNSGKNQLGFPEMGNLL